ncbi:MAG: hypothetical protein QXK47_05480 [Candidatus Bathyarchaeia archaeon]
MLKCLVESVGLTTGDLAKLLGVDRNRVFKAVKGLERAGLACSFPYHVDYYGRKGVHMQPVRIYVATEDGKRLLGYPPDYKPVKPLQTRPFISYEEFRDWGLQPSGFFKALKDAWEPFRNLREAQKAKSQA